MSILRDHASRHPQWLFAQETRPDYNNVDVHYDRKRADAINWLRTEGRGWRGDIDCRHEYKRSDQ